MCRVVVKFAKFAFVVFNEALDGTRDFERTLPVL